MRPLKPREYVTVMVLDSDGQEREIYSPNESFEERYYRKYGEWPRTGEDLMREAADRELALKHKGKGDGK